MITNLPNRNNPKIAAFSLVEVVLALSIMGFVCVTLLGLMATGLNNVQKSTSQTVRAQIIEAVVNTAELQPYTYPYNNTLYFDDEGTDVTPSGTGLYKATVSSTLAYAATNINPYNTANAALLKIAITSQTTPSVTNTFSLVWPNTSTNIPTSSP